jgi:uncharacterized protein DUF4388
MEGDLSLLSIPDLLQMICLGGYSRDIHLFDGPLQLGVIAVRQGRVERCFGFGAWGETAFYKLVNLRRGRYKVNEAQDVGGADATLTAHAWQELLMEAARLQDEAEHVAATAAAAATATGRVIAFPTPASHAAAFDLSTPPPVMAYAAPGVAPIALPQIPPPALPASIAPAPESIAAAVALPLAPAVTAAPRRVSQTMELPAIDEPRDATRGGVNRPALPGERGRGSPLSIDQGGPSPSPDFMRLMDEATASYLRRDLARTEELLQQCLALRPGDKRALQNLERVRRKKSP